MIKKVSRYYTLKHKQREIEEELSQLRDELLQYCHEHQLTELDMDKYKVKVIRSDRKEYNDEKLLQVIPDEQLWKLMSKPDSSKISGLLKMKVLSEEQLKDTYLTKTIYSLQVVKK